VGQGPIQDLAVAEGVAEAPLELAESNSPPAVFSCLLSSRHHHLSA
jgi:hypothetical protein